MCGLVYFIKTNNYCTYAVVITFTPTIL